MKLLTNTKIKLYTLVRRLRDSLQKVRFAQAKSDTYLPYVVFKHASPIRRKLGQINPTLQENKAQNLSLATKKIDKVLINPGETFSFWHLVGKPTAKQGYLKGLMMDKGMLTEVVAGGLCQMSNLIHWLTLHTSLIITELHHHDGFDYFPDQDRKVPFGLGTSIFYNFLDYRFTNNTKDTYQVRLWVDGDYLHGEILCSAKPTRTYEVYVSHEEFVQKNNRYYRCNQVWRKEQGTKENDSKAQLIKESHALVMYDINLVRKNEL